MLSGEQIDYFLSHEWPDVAVNMANPDTQQMLKIKPYFRQDIQ
jgi:hypothetical protein